jgi:hypothetical protein
MFTPSLTPRGEHYQMFRKIEGQTEGFTPMGITSPLREQSYPPGPTSPLGVDFAPGGEVEYQPQALKRIKGESKYGLRRRKLGPKSIFQQRSKRVL